ncbi:MAG: hypothetical protein IJ144_05705 [Prevotella sp.]|nr:hypothetical protein [Prevotella sp.]
MNAQVYLGGALGLGFENKLLKQDGSGDATGMTFAIKPEIGYNLNEKSAVGIVLGFGVTNNSNEMISRGDSFADLVAGNIKTEKSAIQFEVAPYFRYKFLQFEKVDLFIDAQVGFTYTKLDNWNNTTFGIGVRPGIAYTPTEKISLVAKLGNGLFFQSSKNKGQDARSKFGLEGNTLGALEFGMYYNF